MFSIFGGVGDSDPYHLHFRSDMAFCGMITAISRPTNTMHTQWRLTLVHMFSISGGVDDSDPYRLHFRSDMAFCGMITAISRPTNTVHTQWRLTLVQVLHI